jgi:hypothetical protein
MVMPDTSIVNFSRREYDLIIKIPSIIIAGDTSANVINVARDFTPENKNQKTQSIMTIIVSREAGLMTFRSALVRTMGS